MTYRDNPEITKKCKFDITKIWAEIPKNNFKKYGNDSEKIKIKSKK